MSLFRKKEEVPEIPAISPLPNLPTEDKKDITEIPHLPSTEGDGRDATNRNLIKSAYENSSEKIKGDTAGNPRDSQFQESIVPNELPKLPPINPQPIAQPRPAQVLSREELPKLTFVKPEENKTVPEPPPMVKSYPQSEAFPKNYVEAPRQQEQIIKRDANDSIFVRIDKFNSAKRDVEEMERDLRQIEEVLEKISEVKLREDEEIQELNKTLEELKLRISRVDSDVFNRV